MNKLKLRITWMFALMALTLNSFSGIAGPEKELDFDFKEMDFHKAVESIARMEERNVIFAKEVENKAITFSLSKVTPSVALKLLLDTYGYIATLKNGVLFVSSVVERKPNAQTTAIIPLTNVIAKDIEANIKPFIPASGTNGYSINEQRNAFIISAPEDAIREVRKLIEELDQEITQIFIEAKIIDTSTTFSRQLGIEWGNKALRSSGAGGSSGAGATANTGAAAGPTPIAAAANSTGIAVSGFEKSSPFLLGLSAGLTSKAQLDARLTAAENNGDAKTISSPKITTLNGTPATIISATTFTYKTLVNTGSGAASQGASQSLKAGLQFTVTPFIVSDDQVRLNINITKSEPGAVGPDGIPTIVESTATTSLIVTNGETASIGGLISQNATNNAFGVPFLSKIPIFGGLFGSLSNTKENHELLIFMTPTIFKGSRELSGNRKRNLEEENEWAKTTSASQALQSLHGGINRPEVNRSVAVEVKAPVDGASAAASTLGAAPVSATVVPVGTPAGVTPVERLFETIEVKNSPPPKSAGSP